MDVSIVAASFLLTYLVARRFAVPGPGSWAVMCALAVSTWRLSRAGMQWHDLGLRMPESGWAVLAWVTALYTAAGLVKILLIDPFAKLAGWQPLNLSRFSKLPGNLPLFVGFLLLAWIQAAFGEELVFRGFLLTRLELLFGSGSLASAMAVLVQALLFGVAHWYLGARGVTTAALVGLLLGVAYLGDGRNLVPLIIAHGMTDTLSLIAVYSRIVRIT